jgi:hypothetical protein
MLPWRLDGVGLINLDKEPPPSAKAEYSPSDCAAGQAPNQNVRN